MMGRQRLQELREHGEALVQDGHREGRDILELIGELDRLREKEWTPVRLCDALDTTVALYLGEPGGRELGLGKTSVLDLIEWSGRVLRPEGEDRSRIEALNQQLHELLVSLGVRGGS